MEIIILSSILLLIFLVITLKIVKRLNLTKKRHQSYLYRLRSKNYDEVTRISKELR